MSLLDFAVAFGAGAADSLAESTAARHRSKLEEQRQANLARLKAQYATEEKLKVARKIADLATSDDPTDRAKAITLGYKPPDNRTPLQRNVEAAAAASGLLQGTKEYNDFVATKIIEAIGKPVTNIFTGQDAANVFQAGLAAADVDLVKEQRQRRIDSLNILANATMLRSLIESGSFKTGAFGDIRMFLGQIIHYIPNIDESLVPGIGGNVPTAEAINAFSNMAAHEIYKDMVSDTSIRGSTVLFDNIKEAAPNLLYTPKGNLIILEYTIAKAERQIRIAEKLEEYRAKYGSLTPPNEKSFFEWQLEYELSNPVLTEDLIKRINEAAKVPVDVNQLAQTIFNFSPEARQSRAETRDRQRIKDSLPKIPMEFNAEKYESDNDYRRLVNERLREAGFTQEDQENFIFIDSAGRLYRL